MFQLLKWKIYRIFKDKSKIDGYNKYKISSFKINGNHSYNHNFYSIHGLKNLFFITNITGNWMGSFYGNDDGNVEVLVHIIPNNKKQYAVLYEDIEEHHSDRGRLWHNYILHLYVPIGIAKDKWYVHPDWKVIE